MSIHELQEILNDFESVKIRLESYWNLQNPHPEKWDQIIHDMSALYENMCNLVYQLKLELSDN